MSSILVIDDDESLRDTIGIMLEQEGFTPVLVADGKAGFERAMSVNVVDSTVVKRKLKPGEVVTKVQIENDERVDISLHLRE